MNSIFIYNILKLVSITNMGQYLSNLSLDFSWYQYLILFLWRSIWNFLIFFCRSFSRSLWFHLVAAIISSFRIQFYPFIYSFHALICFMILVLNYDLIIFMLMSGWRVRLIRSHRFSSFLQYHRWILINLWMKIAFFISVNIFLISLPLLFLFLQS